MSASVNRKKLLYHNDQDARSRSERFLIEKLRDGSNGVAERT